MAALKGLDRFVKQGNITECWEWSGYKNYLGYGKIFINGKSVYAHRAAWERSNNYSIPDGLVVMHSCDNRACCNPSHLSIGTQAENIADAVKKGKRRGIGGAKGESSLSAKLTTVDVETIRSNRMSPKQIQETYGLSKSYSYAILNNVTWKHL